MATGEHTQICIPPCRGSCPSFLKLPSEGIIIEGGLQACSSYTFGVRCLFFLVDAMSLYGYHPIQGKLLRFSQVLNITRTPN